MTTYSRNSSTIVSEHANIQIPQYEMIHLYLHISDLCRDADCTVN